MLLIWTLIIFVLCATPGDYFPAATWMDLLSIDKLVHATIFFILAFLAFTWGIKRNKTKSTLWLYLLCCVSYGVSLEIMQATLFRNRSADLNDIIANTFGSLIALTLISRLRKFYHSSAST